MSFKKTLIFLLILLLLGGYYYIFEVRLARKKATTEQAEKKLFQVTSDAVQDISLKRASDEVRLNKQDAGWRLAQPVADTADAQAVTQLLTSFVEAERAQSIAAKASDDKEFGFDQPTLVVTLKMKDQEQPAILTIGSKTPTMSEYYARMNDNPAVMTVSSTLKSALDQTVYNLRDKTVLDFDPAQIKQATFTVKPADSAETQTITLSQDNSVWAITAPKAVKADTTKMGTLLSAIKSGKIKEFIAETPQDLSQYGLDKPGATLTLTVGEDNTQKTLLIGKTNEQADGKGGVYAKYAAAANVFLLPTEVVQDFPKSLNDLRDKTLLSYEVDNVNKVESVTATETTVLEFQPPADDKAEGVWKIAQPQAWPTKPQTVRTWLANAKNLAVAQFVTDDAEDLTLYGLEPPQVQFRVWIKGQEQPQQLLLGNADAESTGVYAKLGDQPTVVLVAPDALKNVQKTAFDLRDKTIVRIDSQTVEKFQVKYADTTLLIEKSGANWKAKEPEKKDLALYKVNNVLYDLEALEFTEEIAAPEADLAGYGLATPEVELSVWEKDQKEPQILLVGTALEGKATRYVKLATGVTVYGISPTFLDELPRDLSALAE